MPVYISQMNRTELIREGERYGFKWDIKDMTLTREEMRRLIKEKNPRGMSHDYC